MESDPICGLRAAGAVRVAGGGITAVLITIILYGLLFGVYALGACPSIYVGDSGELVTAAYLLGIPHPSGYPLYVMLGKLWTLLLPFGTVAWRMSLFSAAAAATACALLYLLCRRARLHPVAATFSSLLVAFGPSFWSQANIQRVYALGAVFIVLATAAAWRWQASRSDRDLIVAFFLCGLGATNHTFMAVYAIMLAVFAAVTEPSVVRRPRQILGAAVAFGVGLMPYIYLPLRSRADPRLDWGNPETFGAFVNVVLRREFWGRAWIEGPMDLLTIAADYARSLGAEMIWIGAAFAVAGIVVGRKRRAPVLLLILVMLANLVAVALHGSRTDIFIWHRYYIPSYIMMAILAGLGCDALLRRMPRAIRLLPLGIPLAMLVIGWHRFDRSRYRIAEEFGNAVLRSLPPGAHLSATDDNILFTLIYLHLVEHRRPDMDLIMQGVGGQDLPPLRFNPDTEPLFFTYHPNWTLPSLELAPVGLVFRVERAGAEPPEPVLPGPLAGEGDPLVPKDYLTQNVIGQYHYMLGFTYERRDWVSARRELDAAAAAAPHNDVLFYNLGLILRRNGLLADAIGAFERSEAINPRHIASLSRPRAADRVRELVAEQARIAKVEQALARSPALQGMEHDTAAYHRRLAELLEERSEPLAARGHRLRALELDATQTEPQP